MSPTQSELAATAEQRAAATKELKVAAETLEQSITALLKLLRGDCEQVTSGPPSKYF